MKYDFDQAHERRGTNSAKWDGVKYIFGRDDIIPMWVADMDFPAAKPVVDALRARAEHPFYGYTMAGDNLRQAVVDRMDEKFDWKIQPEWIVFTPGVIPAIEIALKALTRPGDEVILQEPVYYPFFPAVKNAGCQVAASTLKLVNGCYYMDFEDLENKFKARPGMTDSASRVGTIIACNPHNPVGRLWSRQEMTRLGEIALNHGVPVISDEIHCEIVYRGEKHVPFASLSRELEKNCIVCMAPSKTFNLAGMQASSIIIPDQKLRQLFKEAASGVPDPNLFGLEAMEAAYRFGDEWLGQVLDYLEQNLEYALEYFKQHIPRIKPVVPQATYLLWLDCRALKMDDMQLRNFMRSKAKVGLDDGFLFGSSGSGFQRMNIACPRSILVQALGRIEAAVNSTRE